MTFNTAKGVQDGASAPEDVFEGIDNGDSSVRENVKNDPGYYNTWLKIVRPPYSVSSGRALLRELLSGLTVSLAQVPEAVAFSLTAGVDPIVGLQAAWIVGLIASVGGGAPGMVSGATGALAVVLGPFVSKFGIGHLFIAILFMGIIQVVFGIVQGGRLVKLIGQPVMIGFCNGLAIVIFMAQFHSFKHSFYCPSDTDCDTVDVSMCDVSHSVPSSNFTTLCTRWNTGSTAGFQALELIVTMVAVYAFPFLTKLIPASLVGIVAGTVIEFALVRTTGFSTPTIKELGSINGRFPIPIWLDSRYVDEIPSLLDPETYKNCLPTSATLAMIGLVESLMTMQLIGEITNRRPNPTREAIAQGAANIVTGILGGMGGCAMIGQSMINAKSGGITRISTTFSSLFLLLIILVAYPLINFIPVASLAGVMFMVCYFTFEWNSVRIIAACLMPKRIREHPRVEWIRKIKRTDALIIVLVTAVAVAVNLAVAVACGIVLSALVFVWDQSNMLQVVPVSADAFVGYERVSDNEIHLRKSDFDMKINGEDLVETQSNSKGKIYDIRGPVFFASGQTLATLFDYHGDPEIVILCVDQAVLSDYSALVAINQVIRKYRTLNKSVHIRKATSQHVKLIQKAHKLMVTYDKNSTKEALQTELLSMTLAPNWQTIVPVNSTQQTQDDSWNVKEYSDTSSDVDQL